MQQSLARARAAQDLLAQAGPLAERRRTLASASERLFAEGEADYQDVLLARRDEIAARLSLLEARSSAAAASVDLRRWFDRESPDD
jgi:hypothetical protein